MSNEQLDFWKKDYTEEYIKRNSNFDFELGMSGWKQITKKIETPPQNILECGCNIGRNINFLSSLYPDAAKSVIEVAKEPFDIVTSKYSFAHAFNGPITEAPFANGQFDFVFTNTVLIHIHPDDLLKNMQKMYDMSNKYIMISEYFNRTPVMIEYRDQLNKLFKSDFGKTFITNFNVELVDYGFLWGHVYDTAGFDDTTFWLFKKV
jgi:pseudaminic acid biosynthesis-associated methylase